MNAPAPPPLAAVDFWRATPAGPLPTSYKEWSHFSILTPGFDLIVNLSFAGALPRFVVLFSDAEDHWDGDVAAVALPDVEIAPGGADARVGPVSARLIDGRYRIEAALPRRDLRLRFDLTPRARALAGNAIRLSPTDAFNWAVVPHLRATGEIVAGGRRYAAIDAPAYHDRNWGVFAWGGDFAWEWATLVPDEADGPALVYSRMSDRARGVTLAQSLILWRGGRPVRRFYGRDLSVALSGSLRPARVFRLPRFASLIGSGRAADVPRRMALSARGYGDTLDIEIDLARFGQLVAPNDGRSGLTALSEAAGLYRGEGRIGGEAVRFKGRVQAEFKHAAT